jgi:hypothetical protein
LRIYILQQAVGSQRPWRMTVLPRARFQNSHQNGGPVFLIFVADPRPCDLDDGYLADLLMRNTEFLRD